jgi:hypothetical protein
MREKQWYGRTPDAEFDLLSTEDHDLFEGNLDGAYVLASCAEEGFIYPLGKSRVFYIGMTESRSKTPRIWTHKTLTKRAVEDLRLNGRFNEEWYSRYTFAAAFGCNVRWYSVRGKQKPGDLESDLLGSFYKAYGSIPIANGAWSGSDD